MKRKIAIISLSLLWVSFAFSQEPKTEKIELSLRDSILAHEILKVRQPLEKSHIWKL